MTKFTGVFVICLFVMLAVALSVLYAPASSCLVSLLRYKVHFLTVVLVPAGAWAAGLVIKGVWCQVKRGSEIASVGCLAASLMIYTLYAVLLTGGISSSPIASLVAIVPLLTGAVVDESNRRRQLWVYLGGVCIVGLLSNCDYFAPPGSYPAIGGWEYTGAGNNVIAPLIIGFGIVMELVLVTVDRRAVEPSRTNP